MKLIVTLLLILCTGCSTLASREAMVVCQTVDTVTTVVALNAGATELNPLLAPLGIPGIIAVKILLTWWLWQQSRETETEQAMHAAVNVVTCAAGIHNVGVIGKLP